MATMAQITAAVANAQHSTGPRTPEGKAVSSKNATKLGLYSQTLILPGEDPEELQAISRAFTDEYRPQTPTEQTLLDDVVLAQWLKRRYLRLEHEVVAASVAALPEGSVPDTALTTVFIQDCEGSKVLDKIFRRQQFADRLFRRSVADLRKAIALRRELQIAAASRHAKPAPARNTLLQKRTGFDPYSLLNLAHTAGPTPVPANPSGAAAPDPRPLTPDPGGAAAPSGAAAQPPFPPTPKNASLVAK
ncbi:MAG TPA: hypothetical protein VMJ75_01865 [Candidatus Acidoferrales bacterium]|nr:hypothetical protein [Candidatus Acidoferrales bacterium]